MAEVTKYQLISNNNNLISDFKSNFFLCKRKSNPVIYGVVLLFVLFTLFLAFSPSSSPSSTFSDASYRSHFSSIFSYFFPNSTSNPGQFVSSGSYKDYNFGVPTSNDSLPISQNLNKTDFPDKVANFEQNNADPETQMTKNSTNLPQISENLNKTQVSPDHVENIEQNNATSANPDDQRSKNSTNLPQISQSLNKTQVSPVSDENIEQTDATSASPDDQMSKNSTDLKQSSAVVAQNITVAGNNTVEKLKNESSEMAPQISPILQNNTILNADVQKNNSDVIPPIPPPEMSPISEDKQENKSSSIAPVSTKNGTGTDVKSTEFSASLSKNQLKGHGNGSNDEVESMVGCDLYDGSWIRDESYPLYKPGSCKFIDEQFNCVLNGRPDLDFQKLKWKPNGCSIPRLNGRRMLELLRGKRLVFVGDSLNRNMWESLVCILKNSVKHKKNVYEAFGHYSFRTEASYSFVFKDYNCTVEFFVAPFLTHQSEVTDKNGTSKETLRLDMMVRDAGHFKNADFILFNTGHWWTHYKTSKGEDYYQEGSHIYKQLDVTEAFRRAITTWARWVDANVDPQRTHVLFRGYSASHFSGGQWNSGGGCDSETEPIRNDTYLTGYPWKMEVFESVIKGMKTPVSYLNVTRMTDYRKDGHPSIYRKQHVSGDEKTAPLKYQDCSHWCLPGVPDLWNELLYAELLRKQYTDQLQKNKT